MSGVFDVISDEYRFGTGDLLSVRWRGVFLGPRLCDR
jgi:hypothetical protein